MMKNTFLLIAAVLLLLTACKRVITGEPTDNPEVRVHRVFTHDGCTMYRIKDDGRDIHYVRCEPVAGGGASAPGPQAETSWTESCGKGCKRHIRVETQ